MRCEISLGSELGHRRILSGVTFPVLIFQHDVASGGMNSALQFESYRVSAIWVERTFIAR